MRALPSGVRQGAALLEFGVEEWTNLWIGHVRFPVIEVPFDIRDSDSSSHILWAQVDGTLTGSCAEMSLPEHTATATLPRCGATATTRVNLSSARSYGLLQQRGRYLACDDATGLQSSSVG